MVKKTIKFDIYIKTSEQTPTYSYTAKQKVMSNDKDSTQITFNLLDVAPEELSGSSASILLYMEDGSFFQKSDVTINRNSVIYTMKPEETRHSGNTKVQIVLNKGTVQTASLIYNFEIERGLEKFPIVEKEIQDWTSLTAEAKAFVEQIKDFTLEGFVENKMGEELANLETNYATRLTGLEQKDNQLTAQLAQKANLTALNIEKARIDSFTTLAAGSTTGDAELIDGRVGADGITYANIGGAIREPVIAIKSDLEQLGSDVFTSTELVNFKTPEATIGFSDLTVANLSKTSFSATSSTDEGAYVAYFIPINIPSTNSYTLNIAYDLGGVVSNSVRIYSEDKTTMLSSVTSGSDITLSLSVTKIYIRLTYSTASTITISSASCVKSGDDGSTQLSDFMGGLIENVATEKALEVSSSRFEPANILEGYLYASVNDGSISAKVADKTMLSVYFPVVAGQTYTVDKKMKTNYSRLAYTESVPVYNGANQGYASIGANLFYNTFTASQTGYAIIKIYDVATDTVNYDDLFNSFVVYKGGYDSTITQVTATLINTNVDKHIFYCGATRDIKTLKSGIETATQYMDATLYVDAGTYDLVEEFGVSWFDALTSGSTLAGLTLKNRIHIVFSPNSKVVSHYAGNNQYAQSLYAPFNAGEYGYTLENLTYECSRCRYGIHDERNGKTEQYKAEYINCNGYVDNSANDYWQSRSNIGGGLGSNAEIVIDGCVWGTDLITDRAGVYYHQSNDSANTNYKSIVKVKNCYFKTGCIHIDDARTDSTSGETVYIATNNSFPQKYAGTNDEGIFTVNLTNPNSELYAWNNEIRA